MVLGKLVWITLAGACAVGAAAFNFMGPSRGEPCARDCGCAQCAVDCRSCCGDDCGACCGDGQCGMTSAKAMSSCCKVAGEATADAAKTGAHVQAMAPAKTGCCAADNAGSAKSVAAQVKEPCKVACGCPACAEDCRACCGDDCSACCGDGKCSMATKAQKG